MGFFVAPFFASPFFNTGLVQPVGPPRVLFTLEAAPMPFVLPLPQTIFILEAPQ
jgi:hypothetical protein